MGDVSAAAVSALAQSKYERFDSHFSMPYGLSWDEYLADDPHGAQMYLNDAEDDLHAIAPAIREGIAAEVLARTHEQVEMLAYTWSHDADTKYRGMAAKVSRDHAYELRAALSTAKEATT